MRCRPVRPSSGSRSAGVAAPGAAARCGRRRVSAVLCIMVKVQVRGAVSTTPPVTILMSQLPGVVFLVTAAQVSDVGETNTVVCAAPLT